MYKQFRKISSSSLVLLALLLSISYSQSINYLSPSSGQQNVNDLEVHLYTNGVNYYDQYSYNHNNQFVTNNDYENETIIYSNYPGIDDGTVINHNSSNINYLQNNLYPTKP